MNFVIYNTKIIFDKICVMNEMIDPMSNTLASKLNFSSSSVSVVSDAISDIKLTWKQMIYVALIALGLSLVSMIIIRYFAGVFVWLTLLVFIGCFFALAIFAQKESNLIS